MESLKQSELVTLLKTYLKNWKLFVLSFIICIGFAGIYILVKNPEFKIAANILIKEDAKGGGMSGLASSMMKGMAFGDMLSVGGSAVDDELEVISSYSILYETVKNLGLNVDYEEGLIKKTKYYKDSPLKLTTVTPNMADTFRYYVKFKVNVDKDENVKVKAYYKRKKLAEVKTKFPVMVSTVFGDFILDKTSFFESGENLSMKVFMSGYSGATQSKMNNILISVASKKSNVINLTCEDELPLRAIDLLNTIIDVYNRYGIYEKNLTATRTAEFLQQRIDLIDAELKSVEKVIEEYKESNNITNIGSEAQIILTKSSNFKEKLINTETQYTVISMIEDFLKAPENRYAVVPMSLGIEEKSAIESLLSYNRLLLERLKLLRSTNPGNPAIELMNEQVDATRQSVLVTIQSIKRGIEYARNDLRMQEETFMNRIKGMPKQEREYVEMKRQQEVKQGLYLYLLQQQEENALKLAISNPKSQIIDSAFMYNIPVKPMKKLIALAALLFAVLLPVGYLYLRKIFSSKFENMEALSGVNLSITDEVRNSDRSVLFDGSNSAVEEDIRALRSNILRIVENDGSPKSILVASVSKKEGKSFIAMNLAVSIAKMGKKVVLVDTDMRKNEHSLSTEDNLYVCSESGLEDVVCKGVSLNSVLKKSKISDNLYVLPSGGIYNDASELLLNSKFGALINDLKSSFDFVIMDSVSFIDYSDSLALLDIADGVVFVTRANYSEKQSLEYVETLIEKNQVSNYVCVVNDVKTE